MIQITIIASLIAIAVSKPIYSDLFTPSHYTAPAITSTNSNIYRSPGNLGQVSTYHKSISTPHSSVYKSDVRVTSPSVYAPAYAPAVYHAPAEVYHAPAEVYHAPAEVYHAPAEVYHAPAVYHAPTEYHAPAVYHAPAEVYHAPAEVYHAPAEVYHAPAEVYHAPVEVYHAPAEVYHAPAAVYHAPSTAVASHALLGTSYSPATSVSHVSYDFGDLHLAYKK